MLKHLARLVDRPLLALKWVVATLAGLVLSLLGRRPSRTTTGAAHDPWHIILLLVAIVNLIAILAGFALWKLINLVI